MGVFLPRLATCTCAWLMGIFLAFVGADPKVKTSYNRWVVGRCLWDFLKVLSIKSEIFKLFFAKFSNSTQACMMCRVLCFALNIKGKTLATFCCCCLCCACKSLVRSRGVCLQTYLGLSRSRLISKAW